VILPRNPTCFSGWDELAKSKKFVLYYNIP